MLPHDLAGDASDQRRLAAIPPLVPRAKPVPAFRMVGSAWLLRIDNEAFPLLRQKIHPGAGGEIVWRLGAAVKHDDEGTCSSFRAARNEQLVHPASRRVAEGGSDEPCAVRCNIHLGQWSAPDRTWQAETGKIFNAAEGRGAFVSFGRPGLRGRPALPLLDDIGLQFECRRLEPRTLDRHSISPC